MNIAADISKNNSQQQQKVSKLPADHIAAKVIEATEQTLDDDEVSKFTERLGLVFETSRNKGLSKVASQVQWPTQTQED